MAYMASTRDKGCSNCTCGKGSQQQSMQGSSKGHTQQQQQHQAGQERIYSSQQLVTALRSAINAVRDQLSVLSILDSTASSWPGVQQAADDLQQLVEISAKTTSQLEQDCSNKAAELDDVKSEVVTLRETLAAQQQGKDELQREANKLKSELKSVTAKLEDKDKEVQNQKQELWGLERQRADLASELEKYKQDNEFMDGEIRMLRSTMMEQAAQVTSLREEVAVRKADVTHLQQLSNDQKGQIEHLSRTLDTTTHDLRDMQSAANQARAEAAHHEREADRLHQEASRLAFELDKASKECIRLKEWQEVTKRIEADKLREEQDARAQERFQLESEKAALDKALTAAQVAASHAEERLQSKLMDLESLKKQLGLVNVSVRALQQDVASLTAEKGSLLQQLDNAKVALSTAEGKVAQAAIANARAETASSSALSQAREAATVERTALHAAIDKATRETAVQRTLAEGWARDLRESQDQTRIEIAKAAGLQQRLDELLRVNEEGKTAASAESVIVSLKQQVQASQADLKRLKAEQASERVRADKQLSALQRECNESALEVQRLRAGEGPRLPSLKQPITLQDELGNLKRMLGSFAAADLIGAHNPANQFNPASANTPSTSRLPILSSGGSKPVQSPQQTSVTWQRGS